MQPAVFNELIVAVRDLPGALKTWVDDRGFELIAEAPGAPLARMLNVPAEKIGQSALLGLNAAPVCEHGSVWRDIGAIGGMLGDGQGIELEAPSGLRVWVYRRFG